MHRKASKILRLIQTTNTWAEEAGYQLYICSQEWSTIYSCIFSLGLPFPVIHKLAKYLMAG